MSATKYNLLLAGFNPAAAFRVIDGRTNSKQFDFGNFSIPLFLPLTFWLYELQIMAPIVGAGGDKARRIDVSSTSSFATTDFGTNWVDAENIWHLRGAVAKHDITGDIESLATVILNADIDLATGNGDLNGYAIWHDTALVGHDLSGGFEGPFAGKFSGWVYEIDTVCRGYGGFKRTKLFLTITGQEPAEQHEGFIIRPHFE